jgi:hypothetical protein
MYALNGLVMLKRMTITMGEVVYEGLVRVVGRRKISAFLENLARPHVVSDDLLAGYQAMGQDTDREPEALAAQLVIVPKQRLTARLGGFNPCRSESSGICRQSSVGPVALTLHHRRAAHDKPEEVECE